MPKLVNRAKMNTSTIGTGDLTLTTASEAFQSFSDAGVLDGESVTYVIEEGNNWEIGIGVYSSTGPTLTRTVTESSNADLPLILTGNALVYVTSVASSFEDLQTQIDAATSGITPIAAAIIFGS